MAPRGDFPSSKQDQYMVRFPDGMRELLKEEATKNNRSLNAEIIARLEVSFETDAAMADPEMAYHLMQPMLEMLAEKVQQSSLGRVEALLGTVAQSLLSTDILDDATRADLADVMKNAKARLEGRKEPETPL